MSENDNDNDYLLSDEGYTAKVYRLPGTRRVCKSFLPDCTRTHFPVEVEAYTRFTARGHPPTILSYYGLDTHYPAGIVLELAEKGDMYSYLRDQYYARNNPPSRDLLYRWARQAAEALAFAHSCGVLHSDIHCVNVLLDEGLNLKVADFAGASIDGGMSWSSYRTTHSLPVGRDGKARKKITVESEIFALGSALHYMLTGHDVFFPELDYDRDNAEIVRRLREKEFPDISKFQVLGPVVTNCWNLEYESMLDVIEAIDAEFLSYH
ncbi:hypothetical protein MMC14_009508 [Varicellaria rhodocarpa]|nr:hypothetical protein [Varicellaria rhodocarpa]